MSVLYRPVGWTRFKIGYDVVLLGGIALYLLAYMRLGPRLAPVTLPLDGATLAMNAYGTCAFLLVTLALCIGPLARLDNRFLPLLYNRRHLGVMTAVVATAHARAVLGWYFAYSPADPYVAMLGADTGSGHLLGTPFIPFGIFSLLVLWLLAATSHDFWLANLTAPVWKALHMAVYFVYALLVLHVTFGTLQGETSWFYVAVMAAGFVTVLGLHIFAARKEITLDSEKSAIEPDGFIHACAVADIPENRARIVCVSGERVAVFKYDGKISAVSNVCQHQNGPLGEGKIVAGCITCPWHGYQYLPETGASPPPFVEKVPTFNIRIKNGRIFVDPKPNPAGSRAEPALIET